MAGLRCWVLLSRHSSVVSRVPWPLTSMEPPSRTTRVLAWMGRISRAPAALAMRLAIFSSCCQLEYLAQALKRHLMARRLASGAEAPFLLTAASARLKPCPPGAGVKAGFLMASALARLKPCPPVAAELCSACAGESPAPHLTKVQPESRVQTRLVGQRWKWTLSLRA